MLTSIIIAGLFLGAAASFHCIGMCGPISLLLPLSSTDNKQTVAAILLYHAGKISTYVVLGVIAGLIGRQFFLAGLQQYFSIAMGFIIISFYLIAALNKRSNKTPKFQKRFQQALQRVILRLIKKRSLPVSFLIGAANGLLPCGMVYLALSTAMSTGNIISSMIFMAAFGLGIVPVMFAFTFLGSSVNLSFRNGIRKWMPLLNILLGSWLILRGLTPMLHLPLNSDILHCTY